jgi:hypothetical protein
MALVGEIASVSGIKVIWTEDDLVESAALVAVMVTVLEDGMVDGAL